MITLTIITPAFNSVKWLEACIQNVAGQVALGKIEHLIIDGGSSDGSIEILKTAAEIHSHIRWLSEADEGQSSAMNKGLKMARGKWIGFLNADDFYEPGVLPEVLKLIEKDPERLCLLTGNLNVLDENDCLVKVNKPSSVTLPKLLADVCEWPYNPSAYFYPVSLHDKIGCFSVTEHYAMDYDFILNLAAIRISFEYHNKTWGNFRLQPEAKTVKDQSGNQSFQRAESIRRKFYEQAGISTRITTTFLKIVWALRNKVLGFVRRFQEKA